MKEFYTQFFLINLKDYYNLGIDLRINILLLVTLPIVLLLWIAFHLVRSNTFLVVKRLSRRGAASEESAKTLRELGLFDKRILKLMLSGDGQITKIVKRVGKKEYSYEEYTALDKKELKKESVDFEEARFYLNTEQQTRIDKIQARYEVRPIHTALMCVFIFVAFVCAMLLMPEILTGLDWLVGAAKGLFAK